MGRGRISNEEKQKRVQQESINKFGCVLQSETAAEKVEELNEQIKHLESLIENCKNEIQEIEKEALEERKSKAITLLQGLPNETLCEIVNHFEERLKTVESENEEQ